MGGWLSLDDVIDQKTQGSQKEFVGRVYITSEQTAKQNMPIKDSTCTSGQEKGSKCFDCLSMQKEINFSGLLWQFILKE